MDTRNGSYENMGINLSINQSWKLQTNALPFLSMKGSQESKLKEKHEQGLNIILVSKGE